MATPALLDFDRLLAPISAEKPTGAWWREESSVADLYWSIKGDVDASRKSEREMLNAPSPTDNLNPSMPVAKIDPPKWNQVVSRSIEALSGKTKDLWIAAWLIEGLARQPGKEFPGMRDGFRLVRELGERFWGQLHPPPDEEALKEGTLSSVQLLAGLNGVGGGGTLVKVIRGIPPDGGQTQFEDVQQCLAEFRQMTAFFDANCGMAPDGRTPLAPPSTQLQTALETYLDNVRPAGSEPAAAEEAAGGATESEAPSGEKKGRMTRESAFGELLKIADFFERTEPHSPLSYKLRQAVNWGKMSLPELLAELIPKSDARADLFRRTGIPEPKKSD